MNDELKDKIKKTIIDLIKEYKGKKHFKPLEIEREMAEQFKDEGITRRDVKNILRELTDSGELVYGYAGSSFLALPEEKE